MTAKRHSLHGMTAETRKALAGQRVRIWSGEHGAWWRHEGAGYTTRTGEAGIFDFDDAMTRSGHCGPEKAIAYEVADPKVDAFLAANRKSPVVSGRALEPDPGKPPKGAAYTLADGKRFRLNVAQCKEIGMPRWAI